MSHSIKELLDVKLAKKLIEDPLVMKDAGVQDQKIAIDVSGVGAWTFSFDSQGKVVMSTGLIDSAQCVVTTNEKTFEGVIEGSVNVPMAYMMRKIKIKGDLSLAIKVGVGIQKAVKDHG